LKRVLVKLSGEALGCQGGCKNGTSSQTGDATQSISPDNLKRTALEVKSAVETGTEIALVVGAGNLWRGGANGAFLNRVNADKIGMLATVMNAIALNDTLNALGVKSVVLSATEVTNFTEHFNKDLADKYFKKGYVVIFAGGTGSPFFTTDTTAALRAAEIGADMLIKATQVDGVYNADPKKNASAKKYDKLTFEKAISENLKVMDTAAFTLCSENKISIAVFDFHKDGSLKKVLEGADIGTIVS
jgi:uridylate kinase